MYVGETFGLYYLGLREDPPLDDDDDDDEDDDDDDDDDERAFTTGSTGIKKFKALSLAAETKKKHYWMKGSSRALKVFKKHCKAPLKAF